jgi:microsomal prostaglandin-E synthase 1
MHAFTELPAYQPLLLFSVLLVLKMVAIAFSTANRRRKSGVVLNPEDTKVNPGCHAEPQEAPETMRAKRAHLNDLENIPAFLILATLFTLAGGSRAAAWSYFSVYFVARTLHTIFYLKGLQPFRTAMFTIGQIALLGLMVQLLMKAFGR